MTTPGLLKTEGDVVDETRMSRNGIRPVSSWKLRKQEHRKSFSGIFSKQLLVEPTATKEERHEIEINPSKLLYLNNSLKDQHQRAV